MRSEKSSIILCSNIIPFFVLFLCAAAFPPACLGKDVATLFLCVTLYPATPRTYFTDSLLFLISLFSLRLFFCINVARRMENIPTAAVAASLTRCYILLALFKNDRDIEIKCTSSYFDKFEKFSTCFIEPTENGSLGCDVATLNIC